ncbi:MAG: 4-hydroxy-tetrahydrodipicolinate reductase [Alphaproteobacteria bacterium]|nr:4-hydroxy-tetrahydrodipicolinate reductase [Alphaproteobacteria bacterium]
MAGEVRDIVIVGAAGRMGRAIVREAAGDRRIRIVAALEREGSDAIGRDAGALAGAGPLGVEVAVDAPLGGDACIIDFSSGAGAAAMAARAADAGAGMVIGATGFSDSDEARIASAATRTLILKAGNMSLGVNLIARLVREAASVLGPHHFDAEIVETHHRRKVDAPSGTALMLADAIDRGRGDAPPAPRRDGHRGGARAPGDVGFAVVRGGGVIGEHTVAFIGDMEAIEISHRAFDRALFARGAIEAAIWVADAVAAGRRPALVGMDAVLDSLSGT